MYEMAWSGEKAVCTSFAAKLSSECKIVNTNRFNKLRSEASRIHDRVCGYQEL